MKNHYFMLIIGLCLLGIALSSFDLKPKMPTSSHTPIGYEMELSVPNLAFDFPAFPDWSLKADPARLKCSCEGYLWGSHSIRCYETDGCRCISNPFSCECQCTKTPEPDIQD